ncbi:MAG: HAMP domain-containing histidine kinase [Opitutaceae bacterium]|nr:HAMP domain-containing histidine kinase [Opitutaceae bacterium]
MQSTVRLASRNPSLLKSWRAQLPEGLGGFGDEFGSPQVGASIPTLYIVDELLWEAVLPTIRFASSVIVVVGEPYSRRFEDLRSDQRITFSFTYTESTCRLREMVPIFLRLLEQGSREEILISKLRQANSNTPNSRVSSVSAFDEFDMEGLLDGILSSVRSREELLREFRRTIRRVLGVSYVEFYLRGGSGFSSDRGSAPLSDVDPLIGFLARNPVVLDGITWTGPVDPIAELSARNHLALWHARLIVPIHDNGLLHGLIVCGVRDDGHPFDVNEKVRAHTLAKCFKHCLICCRDFERLIERDNRISQFAGYLPNSLMLYENEEPERTIPLAVRALIGQVRRERDTRRVYPTEDQPLRIGAGFVPGIKGTWASWDEAAVELDFQAANAKRERIATLRDIALILNHEIGNALISLSTFSKINSSLLNLDTLRHIVEGDVDRLRELNSELAQLASISDVSPQLTDIVPLIRTIAQESSIDFDLSTDSFSLFVVPHLIEFALNAIIAGVLVNLRENSSRHKLAIQLRSAGEGPNALALISIRGKDMELEGILPERPANAPPTQGRIGLFIAREIIRLHRGSIHAGPGFEGQEILISLHQW